MRKHRSTRQYLPIRLKTRYTQVELNDEVNRLLDILEYQSNQLDTIVQDIGELHNPIQKVSKLTQLTRGLEAVIKIYEI